MTVREDEVRFGDGSEGIYGVVEKPDFALVVPLDEQGLWLVEQYRYPVGRRAWEFPQGAWGSGRSGSSLDLAANELREETGLTADNLRHLGALQTAYGFCNNGFDVYLATGLEEGPPEREANEQDMRHARFTQAEFVKMLRRGEIVDAPTVAAFGLLQLHLAEHPNLANGG